MTDCQDIVSRFRGVDLLVATVILSKVKKPSRFSLTSFKIGKIVEAYIAELEGKINQLNINLKT